MKLALRLVRLPAVALFDALLLGCAALPHLARLPLWVSLVAAAAAAWALAAHRLARVRTRRWLTGAAAAAAFAAAWFGFGGKFSGEAALAFLTWALLLKHAESAGERDGLFNAFGALMLAAWLPLYYENLGGMLLAAAASLLFLLRLAAGRMPARSARELLVDAGGLWLAALPLAALLFAFFPRIPGPLWDIGLALGLPLRVEAQRPVSGTGVDDTLGERPDQPGGRGNATVLVAEFADFVPTTASLYWRGPVFWRYDGRVWSQERDGFQRGELMREAYRSGERLTATLARKGQPVRYRVRLMPHGKHWLYGLDLPADNPAESFVSRDWQLLSIREVRRETQFEGEAWLDYAGGEAPTPAQRQLGLQLPAVGDARLIALGRELGGQAQDADEAARLVADRFARSGVQVATANPLLAGPDALDRLFFDERAAHPTQLAAAFAVALRAAGVPTRLVAGFRGGRVMALTRFVVVKQTDAHVWAEAWLPGSGWTRFDPVNLIAPPAGQAVQPARPVEAPAPAAAPPVAAGDAPVRTAAAPDEDAGALLGEFLAGLEKWVLHFDAARQADILARLGIRRADWAAVLLVAAAVAAALGVLPALTFAWRAHRRRDPLAAGWRRIQRQLEGIGIRREAAECPSQFAVRAARLRPDLDGRLTPLVARYLRLRYGVGALQEARDFAREARRFSL